MTDVTPSTPTNEPVAPNAEDTNTTPNEVKVEEKAPTAAELRKLKLKIDGQEFEHTEEEVIAMAQRAKAGDKAMKEAAQARKQNQEIIRRLKTDPLGLLSDPSIGHDVKKMLQDYMKKELEEANLTPQQKEERELRRKLKEYEEKDAKSKKEEQERLIQERTAKYHEELDTQISEVLQTSRLPKTNYTVSRVAHYMQLAIKEGFDNVQPKDVVQLVRQDYITAQQDLYSAADEDTLIELLGDELLGKVSKAYVKKTSKKPVNSLEKPVVTSDNDGKKDTPRRSLEDWMRS